MGEHPSLFDASNFDVLDDAAKQLQIKPVRFRSSLDEARSFYGWTAHKLDIFELYMKLFRRVAGSGTYLDAFAGTGQISVYGEVRPGSAGIAVASKAFKELRFYEKPRKATQLERWLDANTTPTVRKRCIVRPGDSNVAILEDLDAGAVSADRPCFALLDPNSTELAWETVVRLAEFKAPADPPEQCKVEMWVLLNTHQVLMRLMPRVKGKPSFKVLDRWFGSREAWWDLYQNGSPPALFAFRYAARLRDLGYGAVQPMLIRDPKTSRPQYFMIHASDHPAAHSFMRWASRRAGEEKGEAPQLWT